MDKELLEMLDRARAAGASREQLLGIASAYNQKKKNGASVSEDLSVKSVPGTSPSPSPSQGNSGDTILFDSNQKAYQNVNGVKNLLPQEGSIKPNPFFSFIAPVGGGFDKVKGVRTFDLSIPTDTKTFNQQFEDLTGFRNFDLSEPVKPKSGSLRELAGSDFEKKREESAEDKKHKVYMAEKPKVDKVLNDVYYGMITPEALKVAADNPFTRNIVQNTVSEIAPEFSDLSNPENAEQASKKIAEKNRTNWVAAEQQGVFGIDETVKQFADATTPLEVPEFIPNYSGGPNLAGNRIIAQTINGLQPSIQAIRNINFEDENQVADATQKVKELLKFQSQYYTGAEREKKLKETSDILALLDKRNQFNVSKKGISANVENLNEPIATNVISQLTQIDQTGQRTDVNSDKLITEQFKWGLTLAEKQDPVLFKNITKTLAEGKSVDPLDFSHITRLGQGVYNMTVTRDAATNPELIGKETNFDFATKAERKAKVAGELGEYLQELGMGSMVSVPAPIVRRMGKEKGLPEQLVNELAIEEQLPFYDAIPKSGIASAGVRGVTDILGGVTNTFSTFGESPVDSYLRKKSLNLQLFKGQQVPLKDDEGNASFSNKTQKDNDNVAIGIAEGGGQFLAQLALTYAGGGLLIGGLRGASLGALNPAGKLATSIIDYGGTALSMYAQTYGDSYQQYLEKTGDAKLADTAAKIDATLNGVIETMLPTTQIARMGMKGLRREATDGIVGLLKKESDISLLREKGRGILTRYVTGVGKVLGTELAEEELQNAETLLNEYVFSPQTAKDRNLLKESWDTFKATTVSLALPALLGGAGDARTRDFTTQSLHHAAINFEDYSASLKSLADKGEITEQEYNQGVKLIATHRNSIKEMPKLDIDGNEVADADALKYALEDTKIKIYNDRITNATGVQKEMWEAKKKAAEEVQRGILMPKAEDTKVSEPVEKADEPAPAEEITQPIELATETTKNENTEAGAKVNENAETETTISNPTPQASTTDEANAIVSKTTEEATGTGVEEKPLTVQQKLAKLKQKKLETLKEPKVSEVEKLQPEEQTFEAKVRAVYPTLKEASDADVNNFVKENATDTPTKFIEDFGQDKFDEVVKDIPTKELQGKLNTILESNPDSKDVEVLDKIISDREATQEQGVATKKAEGVSSNSNEDVKNTVTALEGVSQKELRTSQPINTAIVFHNSALVASDKGGYERIPTVYIRFGEALKNEDGTVKASTNYHKNVPEEGVSVYKAFYDKKTGKYVLISGGEGYMSTQMAMGDRKAFLVEGEPNTNGADGENVLNPKTFKQGDEIKLSDIVAEDVPDTAIDGTNLDKASGWTKQDVISDQQALAEAYHKAKAEGSNPELVEAVEDLINKNESNRKPATEVSPTIPANEGEPKEQGVSSNSNEDVNPDLKDVESTTKALEGKMDLVNEEVDIDKPKDIKEYEFIEASVNKKASKGEIDALREKIKKGSSVFEGLDDYLSSEDILSFAKKFLDLSDNPSELKKYLKEGAKRRKDYYADQKGKAGRNLERSISRFSNVFDSANPNQIAESYHKAKLDGSNPELVKAVEDLINENEPNQRATAEVSPTIPTNKTATKEQGNKEAVQPGTESTGRPNAEAAPTVLSDVNGTEIKVGDTVRTAQPNTGILPASEPVTGVVEKTKNAFGEDALQVKYRKEGETFDRHILLDGQINEIVTNKSIENGTESNPQSETIVKSIESKAESTKEAELKEVVSAADSLISHNVKEIPKRRKLTKKVTDKVKEIVGMKRLNLAEQKEDFLAQLDRLEGIVLNQSGIKLGEREEAIKNISENGRGGILSFVNPITGKLLSDVLKSKGYEMEGNNVIFSVKDDGTFSFPALDVVDVANMVKKEFPSADMSSKSRPNLNRAVKRTPAREGYTIALNRGSLKRSEDFVTTAKENLAEAQRVFNEAKKDKDSATQKSAEKLISVFRDELAYQQEILKAARDIDFEVETNPKLKKIAGEISVSPREILDSINSHGLKLTKENAEKALFVDDINNRYGGLKNAENRLLSERTGIDMKLQPFRYASGKEGYKKPTTVAKQVTLNRLKNDLEDVDAKLEYLNQNKEELDAIDKKSVNKVKATDVEHSLSKGTISTNEGKMPIEQYVERARAVLEKLFPGSRLETFENSPDYWERADELSGIPNGNLDSVGVAMNVDGKRVILLNVAELRKRNQGVTVFHEVIHPIVAEVVGRDYNEMNPLWNDLFEQLKDEPGFEKVVNHVLNYPIEKHPVEGITELLAQISDGNISLDRIAPAKKSKILELLNKILEKLGLNVKFGDDYDFKNFAADIKKAFETGDVQGLKSEVDKGVIANEKAKKISDFIFGQSRNPNFQQNEIPSDELKEWTDVVQGYIEENKGEGLSLKEVQDKVAEFWGDRSQDSIVEEAYKTATKNLKVIGKENGSSFRQEGEKTEKIPNELSNQFTKRLNNFVDKIFGVSSNPQGHVRTLKDSDALRDAADKIDEGGVVYQLTMPDGTTQSVKPINADVVNGFYSPLEKTINETKFNKLPAKQWVDKFAKGEEAKWTGLTEWLKTQDGSVSKSDIQNYLKDNRMQIVEVVKGSSEISNEWKESGGVLTNGQFNIKRTNRGDYELSTLDGKSEGIFLTIANAKHSIEENRLTDDTKFSDYQLKGQKENYKEVLVTLPDNSPEKFQGSLDEYKQSMRDKYGDGWKNKMTDKEARVFENIVSGENNSKPKFQSGHFTEPNILVHLRMNTRTDSEGDKVLFLEEIQSDWGQKGKKEGFVENIDFKRVESDNYKGYTAQVKGNTLSISEMPNGKFNTTINGNYNGSFDSLQAAKDNLSVLRNASTPTAPFVTDTNAWTKLGLKVALKEAVKQGSERIAWTNGEQQNSRYDLSKQVERVVVYKPSDDGISRGYYHRVNIIENGGKKTQLAVDKDGKIIEAPTQFFGQSLESVIGKEMAQKIMDVKQGNLKEFSGLDLKVGGKGMKGFYGSPEEGKLGIVGNVAKSLFKQEPKTTSIGRTDYFPNFVSGAVWSIRNRLDEIPAIKRDFREKDGGIKYFNSEDAAKKFIDKNLSDTQHSIEITPQLKAQVGEGLPLFMYNRKGEILGFTDPNTGDIYLNGEKLNPNTPIHEAGHLYLDWAEKNNKPLLEEGLRKIRNEQRYLSKVTSKGFYQAEALKQGKKGSDAYNRYMEKEALAEAIGDSGAQFFMETRRNSFKAWANKLWEAVGKYFGIKNKTPEEIRSMTLGEFTKSIAADILDPDATFEKGVENIKAAESEKPKTESKVIQVDLADVDSTDNTAGITHARMQDLADEYGFDDYIKNPETIAELDAEAAKILERDGEEAIKKIFRKISETANNASPVENRMLLQYVASLKAKFAKNPMDNTVLAALKQAREMIDISNSIAGKSLQSIKGQRRVVDTLDNWMLDKMESLAIDELPEEVKKDIVKKFGKFQEEAENSQKVTDEYESEKDNLAAELEIESAKKQRSVIRRKSKDVLNKERKSIIDHMKAKLAEARKKQNVSIIPYANELIAIAPDISKLVRNTVDLGIISFEGVVDNVHELLKGEIGGITKGDVIALIGGRYNRQVKTKSEIETRVAEIKKEAKLLDELDRLESGGEPDTTSKSIKRNQRLKELRDAIKGYDTGNSASLKTRYDNEIKQLEEDLKNKNYVVKKKLPRDMDSLMQKTNPELWKRTMDARIKRDELKQQWEFEKQQDELKRRNWMQKAGGFLAKLVGTSQAIKAGIDDSVTFIQLGAVMVANPRLGLKSKIEAIRDISNQRYKRQLAQLHASPYWDLMEKSGLSITEPHSMHKERMEEMFRQNLLDTNFKVAGKGYNLWTNTGGIFERLFTSMSNNMRVGLFMGRVELLESQGKTFETHPQEFKDAANAVNNLTSRAKINKNADSDLVRVMIWAPQMLASSLNVLGISDVAFAVVGKKGFYGKLDPQQRKFALSQMGRAIGVGVLVMAAAAAKGWEPDKDPTSSTFGTILVGQTRYSVFGRFTTIVKAIMQIALSKRTTDKGVQDLDSGKFGSSTGGTILGRFFRGKMTPAAGLVYDYKFNAKKNFFTYEPITLDKIPDILVTPMAVDNIKNGLEQDGAWSLLTRSLPAIEGINIYDKRDWKKFDKPKSIKANSRSRIERAGRKTERNTR